MASAFSMLFFTRFSNVGPVNQLIMYFGWSEEVIPFFDRQVTVRGLVATMNFLMWFGNTTILLMAGIMGMDQTLFEAANLDGANSLQVFFKVTLPLLMPVLVYTIITALIGGLQMFDVPQVLTNGAGTPNRSSTTLIMYRNNFLKTSKNYGMAGAVSVIIFVITGLLSILVFKSLTKDDDSGGAEMRTNSSDSRKAKAMLTMSRIVVYAILVFLSVLCVYIFLSRFIIKGVTAGSVKG